MPGNNPKAGMKKDERALALERNPCSMCRAFGIPVCRGHGGGGGGGGDGGSSGGESNSTLTGDQEGAKSLSPAPKIPADITALMQLLIESEGWSLAEGADLILEFTYPEALLSIILDMEIGSLVFRGKSELSAEEQSDLDELFKAIENEVNLFNNELIEKNVQFEPIKIVREGNTLSIKISDPKYQDLFIQQLIEKNLLPNKSMSLQLQKNDIEKSVVLDSPELPAQDISTAPKALDTRGPRPKGWDIDR